jgi:hypothetical protein
MERLSSVQTELERLDQNEQLDYLLTLLVEDTNVDAGHLYCVNAHGAVFCVATHHTLISDRALDAEVAAYVSQLTTSLDDVTMTVAALEHELVRQMPTGDVERFVPLLLRGSDAQLYGIALLRATARYPLKLQTEGLSVVIADVLAKVQAGT